MDAYVRVIAITYKSIVTWQKPTRYYLYIDWLYLKEPPVFFIDFYANCSEYYFSVIGSVKMMPERGRRFQKRGTGVSKRAFLSCKAADPLTSWMKLFVFLLMAEGDWS